jgi:hypothetical protein
MRSRKKSDLSSSRFDYKKKHSDRINTQPCPRYIHYLDVLKRIEASESFGEYLTVRRYLSRE